MRADHRCFSRGTTGAILGLCLVVGGCTSAGTNSLFSKLGKSKSQPVSVEQSSNALVAGNAQSTSTATSAFDPVKAKTRLDAKNSARCRYINANTGIQTTLLRSPTLSGNINNDGDAGISIAYDLMDLKRANLKEESADAQCRRYLAASKLAEIMFVSPQSLTRAGFLARANFLQGHMPKMSRIENSINSRVNKGDMTKQRGTGLLQYLEQVRSSEARSRSESVRRDSIDQVNAGGTVGLDQRLVQAEKDIQNINRRLRSVDAFAFNLSAGYNQNELHQFRSARSDDLYGKVKFSYRLGAANPRRHEFEDAAMAARIEALHETRRGALWRANELANANSRARTALIRQRDQLQASLNQAQRNAEIYSRSFEVELLGPRIRARIDVIRVGAEIAAINATLKDMKRVERNLRFQQPGR